ncbi:cell division protein ZapA [Photobacterium damselae subsp. piscicida]|nr:cell division protein ZapA [Photobacterium damselae subsp. piscicida]
MSTQAIEIQVMGRKLKVNCPAGQEEALHAAAADFDQRLKDLSDCTRLTNVEQLLLFTGLNICNELHLERQQKQLGDSNLSNRITALTDFLDKALQNQPKR